jgi:thiol-disulfide isomerase/thioredoxin
MKWIIGILGVALLAGVLVRESWRSYQQFVRFEDARLVAGESVLPYTGRTVTGEEWRMVDHKGEVVLINVWGEGCPPCIKEFPVLERLHRSYAAAGLRVVGINEDPTSPEHVGQFARGKGLSYPILQDTKGRLVREFGWATGIPQLLLIDRAGRIVEYRIGGILPGSSQESALEEAIRAALAQHRA